MSKINFKASKETGYLIDQDESKLREYALMLPLLGIAFVLGVKVYVGEYKFGTGHTEKVIFVILFVLFIALAVISFVQIKLNKKLAFIKHKMTKEETRKTLRNMAIDQKWKIDCDNKEYFKAVTKSGVIVGKEITIIYNTNGFLTNIRLTQSLYGRFPFTFGKRKLLEQLGKKINTPHNITLDPAGGSE